jgi:hypothetical protein
LAVDILSAMVTSPLITPKDVDAARNVGVGVDERTSGEVTHW